MQNFTCSTSSIVHDPDSSKSTITNGIHELKLDIKSLIESVRTKISSSCSSSPEIKPKFRTDDEFILKFLHVKKFNVDETVKRIQKYYNGFDSLGINNGIQFHDCSKPITQHFITFLKNHNQVQNSVPVLYINVQNWDTKEFSFRDIYLAGLFLVEELAQKIEMNIIVNFNGFGLSHLKEMNLFEVKNAVELVLMGLPVRILGTHLINFPRLLWPIFTLVVKLLPTKLQNRIHIHNNMESLHKFTSPNQLPHSLGGGLSEEKAIDQQFIKNLVEANPVLDSYWSKEKSCNRSRPREAKSKDPP